MYHTGFKNIFTGFKNIFSIGNKTIRVTLCRNKVWIGMKGRNSVPRQLFFKCSKVVNFGIVSDCVFYKDPFLPIFTLITWSETLTNLTYLYSCRSFRGPLLLKPVTVQELFFAVSYSKPALVQIGLWAIWVEKNPPYAQFLHRPARKELNVYLLAKEYS